MAATRAETAEEDESLWSFFRFDLFFFLCIASSPFAIRTTPKRREAFARKRRLLGSKAAVGREGVNALENGGTFLLGVEGSKYT